MSRYEYRLVVSGYPHYNPFRHYTSKRDAQADAAGYRQSFSIERAKHKAAGFTGPKMSVVIERREVGRWEET